MNENIRKISNSAKQDKRRKVAEKCDARSKKNAVVEKAQVSLKCYETTYVIPTTKFPLHVYRYERAARMS